MTLLGVGMRQVEWDGVVFKMHDKWWGITPFILKEMPGENPLKLGQDAGVEVLLAGEPRITTLNRSLTLK